jgi:hypothetical protein
MEATQKPNSSGYRFSVAHSLARSETVLFCSRRALRERSRSSSAFFSGLCSMSYFAEARSAAMTAVHGQYVVYNVAMGAPRTNECSGGCDEESAEGQRQRPEGRVSPARADDGGCAECCANGTAKYTSLDRGTVEVLAIFPLSSDCLVAYS